MNKTKIKILIVEDSPEWIKFHINLLNEILHDKHFEIDFEMSARAGFSKIIKNSDICYDLIISDLEMEDILSESCAGVWFIKHMLKREEYKNSKILIISGRYNIEQIAKNFDVDFIPKHMLMKNPDILGYKLEEMELFN